GQRKRLVGAWLVGGPGGSVPDGDAAVFPGGGEAPAVRAEGHAADVVLVAAERQRLLARDRVPQLDGTVEAGRGQAPAGGAEGHAEDAVARPFLPPEQSAGGSIVDRDLAGVGDAEAATAASEPPAVRAEGHAPEVGRGAAQVEHFPPGVQVPDFQLTPDQFLL